MKIRDRIKELRRVKASEILPNPKNWRTHPKAQQDALRGVLADIGFADAALAYETPNGLMLVDGHLRVETASDAEIPVLVLDITEDEADKLLLTLDPLSSLAGTDAEALTALSQSVEFENEAIQTMLANLSVKAGIYDPEAEWEGRDPVDSDKIEDYDPDSETFSIRVNGVVSAQKQEVADEVRKAVERFGYKVEVF
jgi:hypothetical protein